MEANVEKASKTVDQYAHDLHQYLLDPQLEYSSLEPKLVRLRDVCQNFIFLNYEAATSKNVEQRLWNAHSDVNKKFRPYLASFRDRDGKKKHVERRKAENLYLKFIKSSMRFYRSFIQHLASHFKNVPEIFEVARCFNVDTLSVDPRVRVDYEMKQRLLRSSHAALIYLGDLSRYRETELSPKERNWGPAIGYYDLASTINPASGLSFNQLAVIDLLDKNHLRAVYHLYRALMIADPPPTAQGNLELELRKIRLRHERMEALYPAEEMNSLRQLEASFLLFHARCVHDQDFDDLAQQQEIVVKSMAKNINTQPFDNVFDSALRKMCMINISACKCTSDRVSAVDDDNNDEEKTYLLQVFRKLLSLSFATLRMLFSLLENEFRPSMLGMEGGLELQPESRSRVTSTARRVLPMLRIYSAWLIDNTCHLTDSEYFETQSFWETYVDSLNRLMEGFPVHEIEDLPYQLKEDEDIHAFLEIDGKAKELYGAVQDSKSVHPQHTDSTAEMLLRIKGLVRDGSYLCIHEDDAPVTFAQMQFVYEDERPPSVLSEAPISQDLPPGTAQPHNESGSAHNPMLDPGTLSDVVIGSTSTNMEDMVNNLVESRSGMSGQSSRASANWTKGVGTNENKDHSRNRSSLVTARNFVRQIQHSPSASGFALPNSAVERQTSLSSILPTPFTALSGEQRGSPPGSETSRQLQPPDTIPVPRSSAIFENNLAQQRQAIDTRSSPPSSFTHTAQSTYYQTPTGFSSFAQNNVTHTSLSNSSSWQTPTATISTKRSNAASPFGAVGAGRPGVANAKTPTSGQPG